MQNAVGAEVYGKYFLIFNYTFLFTILLDFGINNFNSRAIAQNPQLVGQYFPNIILIKSLLSILYLLLCFLGTSIFMPDISKKWVLLIAVNQILLSFFLYFRSNLQAWHFFRSDALFSILDRSIVIVICSVLLWFFYLPFQIEWFIYAQNFAYAIAAIISGYWVIKNIAFWTFRLDKRLFINILKASYPFALLALLMSIYNRVDVIMLQYLLPDASLESGIYAAAYRLLDAANMITFLAATILLPMFSRMLKKEESVHELTALSAKLMFSSCSIGGICCYFFQTDIMLWLYHDATPYYGQILGNLMLAFIAIASIYVYGTLLTANKNLFSLNVIALIGVIFNIALNYYFIPISKAFGATQATLWTQIIVAILHILVSIKIFKLQISLKAVIQLISSFFAYIIIAKLAATYLPFIWQINFIITLVISLMVALLFKVIDIKQVRAFV